MIMERIHNCNESGGKDDTEYYFDKIEYDYGDGCDGADRGKVDNHESKTEICDFLTNNDSK